MKPEERLRAAIEAGSLRLLRRALAAGASPDLETPVCSAARAGTLELVRQLVARGGSPSQSDHNAHSPLYWAADGRHIEIMDWLHANGGRFARRLDLEEARTRARQSRRTKVVAWFKEKTDRELLGQQYSIWRVDAVHEIIETSTNFTSQPNSMLRSEETITLQRASPVQLRYWRTDRQKQPVVVLSCYGSAKALEKFDRAIREAKLSFTLERIGDSDYVADVLLSSD